MVWCPIPSLIAVTFRIGEPGGDPGLQIFPLITYNNDEKNVVTEIVIIIHVGLCLSYVNVIVVSQVL